MKMDSEEGTGEGTETSNVFRLPVDWLGPREDLVPVGPRADAAAAGADAAAADPPLRAAAASDFWGEDSAAVQDAWQPLPASAQVGAPEPARKRARETTAPRGRARAPRPVWLAIAAVIVATVAVALGHAGSSASPPHAKVAGVTTAGHMAADGSDRATLGVGTYGASSDRRVGKNDRRRLVAQHKPSRAHARNETTRGTKHGVSGPPASRSGDARTAASTHVAPAPAPQSVDSTPTPESQPATLTNSQGSTAGPTGKGAPFGPGHLS